MKNALQRKLKEIPHGSWAQEVQCVSSSIITSICLNRWKMTISVNVSRGLKKDLRTTDFGLFAEADSSHRELTDESILIGEEISTGSLG